MTRPAATQANLALALMMECQVSLYDFCRALEFFKNPLLKVQYYILCFPAVIMYVMFTIDRITGDL